MNEQTNLCPYCGEILLEDEETVSYYCPNPKCIRAIKSKIKEFEVAHNENIKILLNHEDQKEIEELKKTKEEHFKIFWNYVFLAVVLFFDFKFLTNGIPKNKGDLKSILITSIVLFTITVVIVYFLLEKRRTRRYIDKQINEISSKMSKR